jgi:type II secretory pathway pseudopilin PulG
MTTGKKRHEQGVTLLELLVALIVLIILTIATVSLLNPFKRAVKTDDAAGVLFTLMRQGRLQAITRRQFYAVVINTATSDQVYQLNNSTKNLTFLARSVSLVDMGRSAIQNDEEISLAKKTAKRGFCELRYRLADGDYSISIAGEKFYAT